MDKGDRSEQINKSVPFSLKGLAVEDVWAAGKQQHIVNARSLLCYWAVREPGSFHVQFKPEAGDIPSGHQ